MRSKEMRVAFRTCCFGSAWLLMNAASIATASDLAPLAYIGPGPGLGLIGSLLAVLAAILLGIVGLILYPLRLIRRWRRQRSTTGGEPATLPDAVPATTVASESPAARS
jgi:hypothetical protein